MRDTEMAGREDWGQIRLDARCLKKSRASIVSLIYHSEEHSMLVEKSGFDEQRDGGSVYRVRVSKDRQTERQDNISFDDRTFTWWL